MAGKVRMNVAISDDMREWLEKESKRLGLPMSSLIVVALNTYINQQKTIEMMDFAKMNGYVPTIDKGLNNGGVL